MEKEITRFGKNAQEDVIVKLTTYNGHDLIDIRAWIRPIPGVDGEEPKPTKKGISLRVEDIPKLIDALTEAERIYHDGKEKNPS